MLGISIGTRRLEELGEILRGLEDRQEKSRAVDDFCRMLAQEEIQFMEKKGLTLEEYLTRAAHSSLGNYFMRKAQYLKRCKEDEERREHQEKIDKGRKTVTAFLGGLGYQVHSDGHGVANIRW